MFDVDIIPKSFAYLNADQKLLVKLTPGLNFINVLRAAFAPVGLRQ
jgi:hypothetical protein